MNKLFFFVVFFVLTKNQFSQKTSYSYCPDSSCLTVLFDSAMINEKKTSFETDLKGKWRHKKNDSLLIQIRGEYMENVDGNIGLITLVFFGKTHKLKIKDGLDTMLTYRVSLKQYKKNSKVKLKWTKKQKVPNGRRFYFDSIDIGIIRKP